MNPRPDLDAELAHTSDDLVHASDRSCRSVEGGVEAVPCGVVLDAVPARERIANHRMMREHQLLPTSVTDLGLLLRGADDVRERDRGQDRVQWRRGKVLADEATYLAEPGVLLFARGVIHGTFTPRPLVRPTAGGVRSASFRYPRGGRPCW